MDSIIEYIRGIFDSLDVPLLTFLFFYSIRKRKEEAEARKAETDNITSYAEEWKELYEKKEAKVHELDAKIDKLYMEKEEDRKHMREVMEQNQEYALKNKELEILKCKKRGCSERQPPSEY